MTTAIYLDTLVCAVIAFFGFYTAYYVNTQRKNFIDLIIVIFIFSLGLLGVLYAVSTILVNNNFLHLNIFLNQYVIITIIFLQITLGNYYAPKRLVKNKNIFLFFFGLLTLLSLAGVIFNYQPGTLHTIRPSFFSVNYKISDIAWTIFQIDLSVMMVGFFLDFLINFYRWLKNSPLFEFKYFFYNLAILIYGMVGYFDQSGISVSWLKILYRSAVILCIMVIYIAYSENEKRFD